MISIQVLPARCGRAVGGVIAVGAAAALLAGASPAAAQAHSPASTVDGARAVSGGAWGTAIEVPGTAALNAGGNAAVRSVSCPSTANCSAGGYYTNAGGSPPAQVFVVSEVHGTWGTAEQVPGIAALNTGGGAQLFSVSCASAGNCSAGGNYKDGAGHFQVFVVTKVNGTWGKAEEVPGTATLNTGGFAEMFSVSCAPAGTCSAGGFYQGPGGLQAFVVNKT